MRNILEKFNINFIYLIIILIIIIFLYSLLFINDNSLKTNGLIIAGEGFINDKKLILHERIKLEKNDIFKTVGKDSMGIIEWGDGSITRLGGDSIIQIKESYISNNKSLIQIGFELINGKTWSNVVSFIGKDSHFIEYFSDTEAAVRGTIFNAYYDKSNKSGILSVLSHEVNFKNNGSTSIISEGNPFSLENFLYIKDSFSLDLDDYEWLKTNKDLDKEYINLLKEKIGDLNDIKNNVEGIVEGLGDNISGLTGNSKKIVYDKILKEYQKLHFVGPDDINLFNEKQKLKNYLINFSDEENKVNIFLSSMYDLKDAIKFKSVDGVNHVMTLIGNNYDEFIQFGFNFEFIDLSVFNKEQIDTIINNINNINNKMLDTSDLIGKILLEEIKNVKDDIDNGNQILKNKFIEGVDDISNTIFIKAKSLTE